MFPDSVPPLTDAPVNPAGFALPDAPFICEDPNGQVIKWGARLDNPSTLVVKLRFLEPFLEKDKPWPAVKILYGNATDGTIAGVQLVNFFVAYMAVGLETGPRPVGTEKQQEVQRAPKSLGGYSLGDEVTFF